MENPQACYLFAHRGLPRRPTTFFRTCSPSPASSAGSSRSRCPASSGTTGSDLYQAALAICFRVLLRHGGRPGHARLTKAQGRPRPRPRLAGRYHLLWPGARHDGLQVRGLTSFGRLGIFFAGLFVCAGVMRLARFDVLSRREAAAGHHAPGKYTLGLTIPTAASVLVLMVVVAHCVHPYRIASDGVVRGRGARALLPDGLAREVPVVQGSAADPASRPAGGPHRRLLGPGRNERRRQGAHLPGPHHGLHHARPRRETLLLMRRSFIQHRRDKAAAAGEPTTIRPATTRSCASSAPSTKLLRFGLGLAFGGRRG